MSDYYVSWIVFALIVLAIEIAVGVYARGHWLGILIDNRNRYSLSRLQIVMWTTLLVSAFMAIVWHLRTTSIYIPAEVWALMGISTGSAAAAIIIKDNKSQQQPTQAAQQVAAERAAAAAPGGPAGMVAPP